MGRDDSSSVYHGIRPTDVVVANAFSLGMLDGDATLQVKRAEADTLKFCRVVDSCVGHEAAAHYFSRILHQDVSFNRVNFLLEGGTPLLVGQIRGRLSEGEVLDQMPEVDWYLVTRRPANLIADLQTQLAECAEAISELRG